MAIDPLRAAIPGRGVGLRRVATGSSKTIALV